MRIFGARVGDNCLIRPTARITYPWKLTIGNHAWVGDDVVLYTLGEIEIGDHAVISQHSYICTASHDYRKGTFDIFARPVRIGEQAWIATDVFVGPGVEIGPGTVVGARSSVFESLPGGVIAMGTPARIVGDRRPDAEQMGS